MSETATISSTKVDLNPREVIKKLKLEGNGSEKFKRQVSKELEGLKKLEQIEKLREMFPSDPIWLNS